MGPTTTANTTERRIVFYRADAGLDDDGQPRAVDLTTAMQHIETLPFDEGARYLPSGDDVLICCWVDETSPVARVRLASIRRSGLPQVEDVGALLPLEKLRHVFHHDHIGALVGRDTCESGTELITAISAVQAVLLARDRGCAFWEAGCPPDLVAVRPGPDRQL